MKIGFVDNSLWGLINFRGNIIKNLTKRGNETILIAPNDVEINQNLFESKFISLNINRKGTNPIEDLKLFYKLSKIYKKEKPDIIFHYTIKPNIYGSLAARNNKIKSISVVPGLGYLFSQDNISTKIAKLLYKWSFKYPEEVWFLNNDDKNDFLKYGLVSSKKAKVIPGEGIDVERFKPLEKDIQNEKIVFLMVTRVLWDKGFKEYVEAAEIIKKKYPNTEFQLLGIIDENNPQGVPKEKILECAKKGIINYLGTSSDVPNIIKNSDCLVQPSFYREGIPRTLMEGAAMEKPLITTDNVGCREVVKDGYNGYLCQIKSPEDLAQKIEKFILLSEKEKIKLGKNGRKMMVEKFNEKIIEEIYFESIRRIKS